jgi:hypothetical protein
MGIEEARLAAALSRGQTMAQVAQANHVKERRIIRALVSSVVASVADDIHQGNLSPDQVTWLVALATWRAEQLVSSAFPPIEFRPGLGGYTGDWPQPALSGRRPGLAPGRRPG